MLATLEKVFAKEGLSRQLHIERFRAEFAEIPKDATGGKVRFAKGAMDSQADSETNFLRVAEVAGLNPPHGCRMGLCHTCNTTLKSGCVRDLRTSEVLNEPGAMVQICVCATPATKYINSRKHSSLTGLFWFSRPEVLEKDYKLRCSAGSQ
jgi:ferredoxin